MQKIQVYLYPNRITVLADLDNLTNTEWRIVYQRTVKIYKGIDNIIEIEVKNNDQKRVEIGVSEIKLVLMDQQRNFINTYTAQSLEDSTIVGLARITIPASDINDLDPQFLKFAVYQVNTIFQNILTYTDSQFGALGTIQLLDGINYRSDITKKYDRWTTETNYQSSRWEARKIYQISEAIDLNYNRAKISLMPICNLTLKPINFTGEIIVEGTKNEVIGNEAFKNPKILYTQTYTDIQNSPIAYNSLDISDLTYIRIKYRATNTGSIDSITINL